jgi:hypothetical protein
MEEAGGIYVATLADGDLIYDLARDNPDAGGQSIGSGSSRYKRGHLAGLEDYILEAEYLDAEGAYVRCKMVDLPTGVTVLNTDIPPHAFLGEESGEPVEEETP